jgi:hypothetical protein
VLEPDGAGSAEFAVYFGIAALQTFFAQVDAVFGAHETGFPVRVVSARSHLNPLETKNGFLFRFLTGKETHRKKTTHQYSAFPAPLRQAKETAGSVPLI